MRHFHSYGPVDPAFHFAAERRALVEQCVTELIGQPGEGGNYFTIWGARQVGKTWLMRRAIAEIRARYGDAFAIGALSMEGLLPDECTEADLFRVMPKVFRDGGFSLDREPPSSWEEWSELFEKGEGMFDRPAILLIDEFDCLPPPLIDSMVRAFRRIYLARSEYNLHSLALIGVRAVLGVDSKRGSPFNVQRSLHVENLTREEVNGLFAQYQAERGQIVAPQVVERVYASTRGQPGLVGWLGELLTEKHNTSPEQPIGMAEWERVYMYACHAEPNNTVLNLVQKARGAHRDRVIELFGRADVPYSFDDEACNYLYLNGIIDYEEIDDDGRSSLVCRFSSPFIQLRLYNALTGDLFRSRSPILALDPLDRLTDVFSGREIDAAALLGRYKSYLARLSQEGAEPWKGQPRRADLHLTEAVGHFHLYAWLREALGRRCVVSPEFPTGNGKVDLCLRAPDKQGIIEVKSFTNAAALDEGRVQAARYARHLGLGAAAMCVFVPLHDDIVLAALSGKEVIEGVEITVVAIGWG